MKATKLRFKDFGEVEHDPGAMHPIRVATVHTYRGQGVWAMSLRKAKAIHAQIGKAIQREESAARRVVGKGGK